MARWPPDAQARLTRAALELFAQRGYEDTTVVDIVKRAGLGKTTFFRYFKDKREVLFGGDEREDLIGGAIAAAPASATPLEAVAAALDAAARDRFIAERREPLTMRQQVIDANPQLREREALKYLGLVASMKTALERRGVAELEASVSAELGVLTLKIAFARWIAAKGAVDFGPLVRRTLDEVRASAGR
ncbi:MAG TPA: TetR family transcriptional regulator [Solirubrobacterales bacterium]